MRFACLLLGALGLSACAGPAPIMVSEGGGPSVTFDGFPAQSLEGIVYARAAFDGDYEETFDTDLIDRGVVPVHVTLQLRGQGQDNAQILIKPARMGARLFLLDGTPLVHLPADQVAASLGEDAAREVRKHAFQGGLLGPSPTEGYLFFSLSPAEDFQADGRNVLHLDNGIERVLDLGHSLLAFDVVIDDTAQPFYVGIQR